MSRRWIVAPIAALAVFAGYLGLRLGQPLSETQIITKFAEIYVAEQGNGARLSDCLATPDMRPDIRLVVRCHHPDGTIYSYYSGQRGDLRAADTTQDPSA